MEVKSEEHENGHLMVTVKEIRNWHAYKSSVKQFSVNFLYAMHSSINGI